jgi:uncharacterized protein with PIN domain
MPDRDPIDIGGETVVADRPKFIVDSNVGKLAKWLRMMGYDAVFFDGEDDAYMIARALKESRILLTRDTQIMKRGVVASGRLKAMMIDSDAPKLQIQQVIDALHLDFDRQPFTICLECNQPLTGRRQDEVRNRVPPYVFRTQDQYSSGRRTSTWNARPATAFSGGARTGRP